MSRCLFEVGETIILKSIKSPEFNGEYIVELVVPKGQSHCCRISGYRWKANDKHNCYVLSGNLTEEVETYGNSKITVEIGWQECALRKKHKPSEFGSYDQLMKNLKIGEKV